MQSQKVHWYVKPKLVVINIFIKNFVEKAERAGSFLPSFLSFDGISLRFDIPASPDSAEVPDSPDSSDSSLSLEVSPEALEPLKSIKDKSQTQFYGKNFQAEIWLSAITIRKLRLWVSVRGCKLAKSVRFMNSRYL